MARFLLAIVLFISILVPCQALILGAEQPSLYLPKLADKRVGLVVNQSSRVKEQHLVDFLIAHNVNVTAIYAPEHGFRGDKGAGENIDDQRDAKTGLPIYSLYGDTRKPTADMLANVDVLLFDIQDVGVRFYTYISTLHYVIEAASENAKQVIVLDRPNPNISFVDGPILDTDFASFVGMHPIPVLHGMTVAELAQMMVGEQWVSTTSVFQLDVIAMRDYTRKTTYDLPIAPSPNLPNAQSIKLYPSLCFFEPTHFSIGRGTAFPFQVIGHPRLKIGEFGFTPVSLPHSAPTPKHQDIPLYGIDLREVPMLGLSLKWLIAMYRQSEQANESFFSSPQFFDKLAGTDQLRLALQSGKSEQQIRSQWAQGLTQFKQDRTPYLLYAND